MTAPLVLGAWLLLTASGAPLDLRAYRTRVLAVNPELQAARAGVDIARAQVPIARVFPDPQLSAGVSQFELTRNGNPTATTLGIALPIELGGKRSARIAVAEAGLRASGCDLDEAIRGLRASAGHAFVDSLHAQRVTAQKRGALEQLQRLVAVNEKRLAAGDLGEGALLQSRVEAHQLEAEVLAAEGEQRAAEVVAAQWLAEPAGGELALSGNLGTPPEPLHPDALLAALEDRPDVRAARARVESAAEQVKSEEAKRIVDVELGLNWAHNFAVHGETATPAADFLGLSLSVPLPFSRLYRGELEAALGAARQTEHQLAAARLRAHSELRQALARFDAADRRVAVYDQGTLKDAQTVLDGMLYSYQRGSATLVEVLIARRTQSDVQGAYDDALADRAHALLAVEQASAQAELLRL